MARLARTTCTSTRSAFAAALLLTVLVACSRAPQSESIAAADAPAMGAAPASTDAAQAEAGSAAMAPASRSQTVQMDDATPTVPGERPVATDRLMSSAGESSDPRRRFVRTASASFGVADVYDAAMAIEDAAAAEGGFVVGNRIGTQVLAVHERSLGDGRLLQLSEIATQGSLVVRVPGERTQAFLRGIVKHVAFIETREFGANDVQFDLLRRELAARRAALVQGDVARAAQQGGRTDARVDAALARGEVLAERDEALVSRRELEDQVAFSTLRLELRQPAQVRRVVVPDTRELIRDAGPGFFAGLGDALADGWRGLLAAIVGAARLWPLWLALAGVVLAIRLLARRRRLGKTAS